MQSLNRHTIMQNATKFVNIVKRIENFTCWYAEADYGIQICALVLLL